MVSSQNYGCLPSPRANWSVHGSREISGGTSNGTDHFGLVGPGYPGPALKVVHFVRSGLSDRNVPFHLTKLLSLVALFCILLTRTITKRAVA